MLSVVVTAGAVAQGTAKPDAPKADNGPEKVLTLEQQKVILADIDATLKFVSADTKLELKKPVKRRVYFARCSS